MTARAHDRQIGSVITEMPVPTIARTAFVWERDYGPLYRACPDAFWLAPDADDVLPGIAARAAPNAVVAPPRDDSAAPAVARRVTAAAMACVTAGPIFLAIAMLLEGAGRAGVMSGLGHAAASLFLAPFSIVIGAVLAVMPVALGTLILGELGLARAASRRPLAWTAVGAMMGIVIAAVFAAGSGVVATGLVLTSAACARIANAFVRWEGPLPA